MNIRYSKGKHEFYSKLNNGDCFAYNDVVYIKSDVGAIRLANGLVTRINDNIAVTIVHPKGGEVEFVCCEQ